MCPHMNEELAGKNATLHACECEDNLCECLCVQHEARVLHVAQFDAI